MLAEERRNRILDIVLSKGSATVPEFMESLNASESTVRRDLNYLDSCGSLIKVHGGATATRGPVSTIVSRDASMAEKTQLNSEAKRLIAQAAASLVTQNDMVYIDAGTTTAQLVEALEERGAVYVTNSIPHAQRLLERGFKIHVIGGEVKPLTEAIVGEEAINSLRRYHFTLGFWGTNGANPESGFTTPEFGEAMVKQVSLEHTRSPYVLCDAGKFSQMSLLTFADFGDATVICDDAPDEIVAAHENIMKVGGR